MIKIECAETYGWEAAVRGMRNPLNSWAKSDTDWLTYYGQDELVLGENDCNLMKRLISSGTDHSKFMRMITVTVDLTAPLYWWKEFDTYKVGTVANSCSTMHKIQAKRFVLDDFSYEHLMQFFEVEKGCVAPLDTLCGTIAQLNYCRDKYLETQDKDWWWQMIQLLPSSYNQKRTVQLNYAVLRNIYHSRKNHKLDEWRIFCNWIENLPYWELITM